MSFRLTVFIAVIVTLQAGCAQQRTLPAHFTTNAPETTLTLFTDGFHSGAIISQQDFPLRIHYRGSVGELDSANSPWVEIGYSEHDWILGIDRSFLHVARLCFVPADGLIFIRLLPTPERLDTDLHARFVVRIPITERAMDRVRARLIAWTNMKHLGYAEMKGDSVMAFSTYSYSVWNNCHDFTADMMSSIGLPTSTSILRLPGSAEQRLREAAELIALPGFTAVDVPPESLPAPH
jgi:hypothetical protein